MLYSGNEIGPFRAVEESTLAHLTPHEMLSDIFAWYSLFGTAGTALGMMACGWAITILQTAKDWDYVHTCRVIFLVYATIGGIKFLLTIGLSKDVEAVQEKETPPAQQQQQQQQSAAEATETQPLLADTTDNEGEQAAQGRPETSRFSFIDKEVVSLMIRLFILFALDSFASGLASL